jgi:hypothetical protein
MTRLVIEALFYLLRTEWLLQLHRDRMLQDILRRLPTSTESRPRYTPDQICRAMDIACVVYFKAVLCQQRSVATTMLLRHYGFPAELVIGARIVPFGSHAWVELHHLVINDKPYVQELYRELERCSPALDSGETL